MENEELSQTNFDAVVRLTQLIYAKREALVLAETLSEKLAIKQAIQELVNERTRLANS